MISSENRDPLFRTMLEHRVFHASGNDDEKRTDCLPHSCDVRADLALISLPCWFWQERNKRGNVAKTCIPAGRWGQV
jgi:hypothetical protein